MTESFRLRREDVAREGPPTWQAVLVLELWQAEWCPFSHRVRQRLTELGLPFVARQVPVARGERKAMEQATGTRSIPALVDGETVLQGVDAILAHLGPARGAEAAAHARRAAEEWPHWLELHASAHEA